LLECSRARCVIAAETDRHNTNTLRINFVAGGEIFPDRRRVVLGIMPQVECTKTDTFAVSWTIDDQTCDASSNEIGHTFEVLNLLGDIETVEKNNRWHFARIFCRLGMDIDRRHARFAIRNFHVLDEWPSDVCRGISKTTYSSHVGVEPFLILWLQEALSNMKIGAGAPQVLSSTYCVPFRNSFAAARLYKTGFTNPFAEPHVIIAHVALEPKTYSIDLSDFCTAPGRHVESNQETMRPSIVVWKIDKGQFFRIVAHTEPPQANFAIVRSVNKSEEFQSLE